MNRRYLNALCMCVCIEGEEEGEEEIGEKQIIKKTSSEKFHLRSVIRQRSCREKERQRRR